MAGEQANVWTLLLVLLVSAATWWWANLQLIALAKRRQWGKATYWLLLIFAAPVAAFGAFCITGGLLLPDPSNAGDAVAVLGILLLIPFAVVHYRNHQAHRSPTQGATAPAAQVRQSSPALDSLAKGASGPLYEPLTLPHEFAFQYSDQSGQLALRTVRVTGILSNGRQEYLDGICIDRQAARTFRVDRITSDLIDQETGELVPVERLLSDIQSRSAMTYTAPEVPKERSKASTRPWQTAVLFTGFSAKRREELEDMAFAMGWDVRSTVGSTLDVLVTGPKAGPSKVAEAEALGIEVIDEFEFEMRT